MRVGSSGARPEEERAAEVQSDLKHDARPRRANKLEQPLDLLAFLPDSDLRVGERVRLVEGGVPAIARTRRSCLKAAAYR